MTLDYQVGPADFAKKPFGIRVNRLQAGNKTFDGLATAYRKGIPTGALPPQGIQEVFLSTKTDAIDNFSDNEYSTNFIRQASFGLDSSRINVFFTRLSVTDPGLLNEEAVNALYDLLNHPHNDVLAVPTLTFEGKAEELDLSERLSLYEDFTTRFLKTNAATGAKQLAFTMPLFYPSVDPLVENLYNIYERNGQHPSFYLADMGAQRLTTSYSRLGPIHRIARKRHGKAAGYFVYAASLAPFKRSSDAQPAEDIVALASCGINAVGPKHGPPAAIKEVPGQNPLTKLPKLFDDRQLQYTKLTQKAATSVANWVNKFGRRTIEAADLSSGHVHGYNALRLNAAAQELARMVKAGDHQGLVQRLEPTALFESVKHLAPLVASPAGQSQLQ